MRCGGPVFDPSPIVVAAEAHRFLAAEGLAELGIKGTILLEPVARNSCAAIAAGALAALARRPDAMILVLAADHRITDAAAFAAAVEKAAADAGEGRVVTFGIRPTGPATGYGYIRPGAKLVEASRVDAFVEKPDQATAARYVSEGYLWNSGNFLFRADAFIAELQRLQPEILAAVKNALEHAHADLDFIRLSEKAFAAAPSISVDYAVMEKTDRAAVLPVSYGWSDIGSWNAVWETFAKDDAGNVIVGDGVLHQSANNLVHSSLKLTTLVGVENMAVISTRDAVLVMPRERSEDTKNLVDLLKASGRNEAVEALQMFRPWGNYEQLDIGDRYQVKRIVVTPGGVLSLQRHKFRSEHWVVVEGEAEVTIGADVRTVMPNESVYIPLGETHRLANRGTAPVVLIEIQTGSYFGEDDIERLEDVYNRPPTD